MSIEYYLTCSELVNQEGYLARVISGESYEREKIIELMESRGTTLTKTDIRAVLDLFEEVVFDSLLAGHKVNMNGFVNFGVSIGGVFSRLDNKERDISGENLKLKVIPSRSFLKRLRAAAELKRCSEKANIPVITEVEDLASQTKNRLLTRGRQVIIKGSRLGFNDNLADEGIFIYFVKSEQRVRVEYGDRGENKRLKFLVPLNLAADDNVVLEVRSRLGTKTVRTGFMEGLRLV